MALINCSECGKEVSDKAAACPHCGNPIATEKIEKRDYLERNFWRIFALIVVPIIIIWSVIGIVAVNFLTTH